MRKAIVVTTVTLAGAALLLAPAPGRADRWDVRQEAAEGNREIRRERREAVREIANADSPWEVRQEIREAHREVNREIREKRREVRREVNQAYWGW
jgi:gas vesicle protein